MKNLFLIVLLISFTGKIWATDFTGFVETESGTKMYVEYTKAQEGKKTFVFVNGLIYEIERWQRVTNNLAQMGYGILHYELEGQNRTYVQSMEDSDGNPDWLYYGMKLDMQAGQLKDVLDTFLLTNVELVSLSYGSSISSTFAKKYPDYINNLIFMSPLVFPLEKYDPQGRLFHLWLDSLELWGPVGSYWANYYYDLVYKWYFGKGSSTRNYDFGKWEKDYYKAVFHQTKSVRKFDLRKLGLEESFAAQKIHLITASKEEEKLLKDQQSLWSVWESKNKGSLIHVEGAWHAIPDTAPGMTIALLNAIAEKNSVLFEGNSFKATVQNNQIVLLPYKIGE